MRVPRIYSVCPVTPGVQLELGEGQSQHVARALRMQANDSLVLFDGSGAEYPATITAVTKKRVTVTTGEPRYSDTESPLAIHLGIAVSRGERMDWITQKATELGVTRISPLLTERVEVKLRGERADKKIRHWQKVAISACEQCGRNTLPDISPLQDIGSWLAETSADRRFVLHHRALQRAAQGESAPSSVALLVGPEGGLGDAEIQQAERAGYESLRLGPRILRTETAPLAAIAILQSAWGDMGQGF